MPSFRNLRISIIEEVAYQTNLLAQVTQRNASASEELASTAEELSSQAEALLRLVSFFHLREGSEGAAHLPPRAPGVSTGHGLEAAA